MAIFKSFFGSKDKTKEEKKTAFPWIPLTTVNQLEEIKSNSKNKTQLIFKHSTTCGISNMVIKMFTSSFSLPEDSVAMYYLDLQQYRAVSNEVADMFNVWHESPQLLVIKEGKVVFHTSHGNITEVDLERYI